MNRIGKIFFAGAIALLAFPPCSWGQGITATVYPGRVNPKSPEAVTAPANPSGINPAESGPLAILRERDQTIREIMADDNVEEAKVKERLKVLINGIMDFPALARLSLGTYWKRIIPADQEKFVKLFKELIEITSTKKLDIFKADRVDYPVETISGDKAEVRAQIYKGREKVEVVYSLHQVKGEWKIYNMVVDELGLAENYRTQFIKIIRESRFAGLLKRLQTRIIEEKKEAAKP